MTRRDAGLNARRRRLPAALCLAALSVASCSPALPPSGWARGGAPLSVPHARWVFGELAVDLSPSGRVLLQREHVLTIDGAGRVYDRHDAAVALLEADGTLLGPDDEPLGEVGSRSAALPEESTAWLVLTETGEVVRYDSAGAPRPFGVWRGCHGSPYASQTCTLVTHLIGRRLLSAQGQGPTIGLGIGVGVGVPLR